MSGYKSRDYLANVYLDTKNKCLNGYYGKMNYGLSFVYYSDDTRFRKFDEKDKFDKTVIDVVNCDVLELAEKLAIETKSKVLVLNLASDINPGGGVKNGAMAQEEELFRRTNYFMSLTKKYYPLEKKNAIYTPDVLVVKDKNYNDLEYLFNVSMLAVAAIRKPYLKDNKYNDADYSIMLETIENIFKTAYTLGYTVLVLGALGCGAFGNPPLEVVKMYNQCLLKYGKYFKNISFAVLSKGTSNYTIFETNIVKKI